jgi:hypothetical protein
MCRIMDSVVASSVVEQGFESRKGQVKYYIIGICCFSDKHATFKENEQRLIGSESG